MMHPLSGLHVLLVEDEEDARAVMKMVMEYQGALVMTASEAEAALSIMDTVKPDVLISDISMPGHDGWWLIREARRLGKLDGTPALAVTALELKPQQITDAGFQAYLRKPVDPQDLCNTVQMLARGRKQQNA